MKTYNGSCHCGAIKYEVDLNLENGTNKCNCTYCRKARSWKAFVKPAHFRLIQGQEMSGYRTNEFTALKYHCAKCGMFTHEEGDAEWMGGKFVGVQVASIDNIDEDELANAPISIADGLHNNWRETPADTRNL